MNVDKIEKLEEVLILGPNQRIKDYKLTRLTAAGENYGSLMLRLQVNLIDEKNKSEEALDLVAKLLPPNDLLREIFNVQVTFKNEANLYSVIVPALEDFQRQQGAKEIVDIFAKFYGARFSLDPSSDKVDEGAVLLLENVKTLGYNTLGRTIGFDLPAAELVLKNLAYFHATSLALKMVDPDIFDKKIRPHLNDFDFPDHGLEASIDNLFKVLKENPTLKTHTEKLKELMKQKALKVAHEPFATIMHNDFWANNTLLKYENGKPVANILVDFQLIEYKSPCRDLIYALFSSVQLPLLKAHVDELIDHYYKHFIEKLEELKCDISPFSRKAFDKEMELAAKEAEYFHLIVMVFAIYDTADYKELSDLSVNDFHEKKIGHACKERILYITEEFIKRGWI